MTDQYREQYKKETEQIHAPAALIARTKAAMREEEARIRREFTAQTAEPKTENMPAVSGQTAVPASDRKDAKRFDTRKWAYPLTAAAALLILVSVSLTMRGLKSKNMTSDSPAYEEMAVQMESAEMSGGEDLDAGMAAGAAADSEGLAETADEAFADEAASVERDMAASPAAVTEAEDLCESVAAADDAFFEETEPKEARQGEQKRKLSSAEKSLAEDEAPVDNGAQSGGAAAAGNITIEKVIKRPEFCGRPDTETRVFEGETFQIAKEENEWAAYVETEDGGRYVIRGEAEDADAFLEAGYQKLLEIK